jgi:hypothetical protein
MILMTANPWKHPDSGFYWFRRRVPDELRMLVGKREERFSLGTREPAEAKRRHALKAAEVEKRWANLRLGPQKLGWDEAVQLGGTVAARWSQQLAADPHQSLFWDTTVGALLWKALPKPAGSFYTDVLEALDPTVRRQNELEGWCKQAAESLLRDSGSDSSPDNILTLAKAISISMQRAANEHHEYLEGRSSRTTTFFSATPNVTRLPGKSVDFEKIVSGWATEKSPNEKTLYTWRRIVAQFAKFVGHTDAASVTPDMGGPAARLRERYDEASRQVKLYRDPDSPALRSLALEQLWREHMLAQLAVDQGITSRAIFLAIGPKLNRRVMAAFRSFQTEIIDVEHQEANRVAFEPMSLETFIDAIQVAGAEDLAKALWKRYCDFQRIYDLSLHAIGGDVPISKPDADRVREGMPLAGESLPLGRRDRRILAKRTAENARSPTGSPSASDEETRQDADLMIVCVSGTSKQSDCSAPPCAIRSSAASMSSSGSLFSSRSPRSRTARVSPNSETSDTVKLRLGTSTSSVVASGA